MKFSGQLGYLSHLTLLVVAENCQYDENTEQLLTISVWNKRRDSLGFGEEF
jgi:hypothetical protein